MPIIAKRLARLFHYELKRVLRYDADTGYWFKRSTGRRVDVKSPSGYRLVRFRGKHYRSHRLAQFYMTGFWPPFLEDHANRDPSNNRWKNIRPATYSQNVANSGTPKHNTSGYKGVRLNKNGKKWRAQITAQYKTYFLGTFDSPEEAYKNYCKASVKLFGEFAPSECQKNA